MACLASGAVVPIEVSEPLRVVLVPCLELDPDEIYSSLVGKNYICFVSVVDDNGNVEDYRFLWPSDAMGAIQSIFVSDYNLYASSASVLQLQACPIYRNNSFYYKAPKDETTVLIGRISSDPYAIRASKTNLKVIQ